MRDAPVPPRFSVIVPAYNAAKYVPLAIRSVLRQTWNDFELIVVDDGSTDATAELVRQFDDPRLRVIRQANRGPAAARNAAIAAAGAAYVCMLDSDDLWLPAYLERMGAALDAEPSAGFAYTDAWIVDHDLRRVRRTTAMRPPAMSDAHPDELLRLLLRRNFVFTSAVVRREALLHVGGYDERLRLAEDWELWLRLAAAGFGATGPVGVLAMHRLRSGSLSSDPWKMATAACEVYRLVESEWQTTAEVRELARSLRVALERRLPGAASRSAIAATLVHAIRGRDLLRREWMPEVPPEIAATLAAVQPPPA